MWNDFPFIVFAIPVGARGVEADSRRIEPLLKLYRTPSGGLRAYYSLLVTRTIGYSEYHAIAAKRKPTGLTVCRSSYIGYRMKQHEHLNKESSSQDHSERRAHRCLMSTKSRALLARRFLTPVFPLYGHSVPRRENGPRAKTDISQTGANNMTPHSRVQYLHWYIRWLPDSNR